MNSSKYDISDIIETIHSHSLRESTSEMYAINNNKFNMTDNTKRYLISSIVTFLSAFALVLLSQWDSITLTSLKDGSILGLIFIAVRAGIKGVIEYFLSLKQ